MEVVQLSERKFLCDLYLEFVILNKLCVTAFISVEMLQ